MRIWLPLQPPGIVGVVSAPRLRWKAEGDPRILLLGKDWFQKCTTAEKPGALQATQIGMAPMAVWPLDNNMVPDCSPDPLASALPLIVSGAMDINTDPGCGRAMDPDMNTGSSPGMDDTMAPGEIQATQIGMALGPTCPQVVT
ncbi:kelch-like protein 2 [Cricetulus griseus]|nr:kelch-like protein 2 [Cricetulus griseus]